MLRTGIVPRLLPAAVLLAGASLIAAQSEPPARGGDHAAHLPVSSDERVLRQLLRLYQDGDVERAVREVLASPSHWLPNAVDATVRRTDDEIRYHRRAGNRTGAARDEQLEGFLRADRLQVLVLAAAVQLRASAASTSVDLVGSHVVGSERALEALHGLRRDFEQNGPVPWPVAIDNAGGPMALDGPEPGGSADWPAVQAFANRCYAAAVASLQRLVELKLLPAVIARGLARFRDDPVLLLAGSVIETRLALSQVDASLASEIYSSEVRQRWRPELRDAERDYEPAAGEGGAGSEAAVRLARVHMLSGELALARDRLDRVLAGQGPEEVRYLALIFRAAAAEQPGDAHKAAQLYEQAARLFPGAQTPLLALARLADETGNPADARGYVERALTTAGGAADPWRRYIQGQAWQLDARTAVLRLRETP